MKAAMGKVPDMPEEVKALTGRVKDLPKGNIRTAIRRFHR
jgi:hypothetical protein